MKRTNQKGITLIALIVTIIVLIIIAGISIATLTADNGILRQTNSAKVENIEGTAREQVKLAMSAMRLAIAEAQALDNSYKASDNRDKIKDVLLSTIQADTTALEKDGWSAANDTTANVFKITYAGDDYKQACNYDNAEIVYTITLGQKSIEITNETNATLKDQGGNDVNLDIGGSTGTGSGEGESGGSGNTQTTLGTPTVALSGNTITITAVTNATSYDIYVDGAKKTNITTTTIDLTTLNLTAGTYSITVKAKADGYTESQASIAVSYTVQAGTSAIDILEIGDWVDLGDSLDYTNQYEFTSGHTTATSGDELTGWRVLSKNETTGEVTLVSAGTPLKFYHKYNLMQAQTAIDTYFDNLNTEITIVASDKSAEGFTGSGFTGVTQDADGKINLANVWSSNSKINASSAHVLTTDEVVAAYKELTGSTSVSTINNLIGISYALGTSNMQNAVVSPKTWNNQANDLLGIGQTYWPGGSAYDTNCLWVVNNGGSVGGNDNSTLGLRACVSLNSGITIDTSDTSKDGSTLANVNVK